MTEIYDYIVVGAGSSGCVVASRLSEDAGTRVLLVEAGSAGNDFWVKAPAGMGRLFLNQRRNWNYFTEPVPTLNGRKMYFPRGKILGGTSAINGMVYMRGHPLDYDHWEGLGNQGWGWDSVLPFFKRSENNQRGANAYHGSAGPLHVSDPVLRHPSSEAFIESAERLGIVRVNDLNAPPYEGVSYQQFTIHDGKRESAYTAFIKPVLHRRNLTVLTAATTLRVLFKGQDATGIEIETGGRRRLIMASREVVLSAGVTNSAQLLMLSGLGEPGMLQRHHIPVKHALPGVGQNMQDHWFGTCVLKVKPDASYNNRLHGVRKYLEGARYMLTRSGYLALGASPLSAYVKSSPDLAKPDLQLVSRAMTFNFNPAGDVVVDAFPGVSAVAVLMSPESRGHMELKSADPLHAPAIYPNHLSHSEDTRRLLIGMRLLRKINAAHPFASRVTSELVPGPSVETDEQLLEHIKNNGNTSWHPVGTCKMGGDSLAVVDARLRVHGVRRLRVIDASIMPKIVAGNTSAPAMMIGEKGADMIRADATPAQVSPWP